MTRFRAKLYLVALIRWVDLPKRLVDPLRLPPALTRGGTRGLNAVLRFNDDIDRVTLLPGRRGCYKLAIKVELLRAAGVEAGDTIDFTLEPDTASREPELPDEMRRTFQSRPELATRWMAHSVAVRRQVVRYIDEAKSAETRAKRCWLFLDRLTETGRLGGP
ncbi:MAG: YdeI/OmpD-associated family protein [Opitutales bacterium]